MSEKLKKYSIEAASESSEAAFIFCNSRPCFKAKVHKFSNFKDYFSFESQNATIQVHKLPILLEVVEIEENFYQKHFEKSFKQMAHWYYFTQIKPAE